jgi:hypothetical protein
MKSTSEKSLRKQSTNNGTFNSGGRSHEVLYSQDRKVAFRA